MLLSRSVAVILLAAAGFVASLVKEPARRPSHARTPARKSEPLPSPIPSTTCLITQPPSEPFIPPVPYPSKHSNGSFWFGSEKLWTMRNIDGLWHGYWTVDADSGFTHEVYYDKVFWWRKGYDWRTENPSELKVTGKRIDAPAPPLYVDRANAANMKIPAMVTGIDIPTAGCWEITGNYKGDKLTFVVWVVP